MPKIRILVVDDAVVIRRLISEVLNRDPNFEVVGVAANGKIALQKIEQVNPDAITLDVEMPEMDGLETVKQIRKKYHKIPIIMFSTLTERGGEATLEALAAGASDYVTKPGSVSNVVETLERLKLDLIPKLKAHCKKILPSESTTNRHAPAIPKTTRLRPVNKRSNPNVLCIGTSTGGPNALAQLIGAIPVKLPIPVFIVQHMPPTFTKLLADRLDKLSPNACYEASHGQKIEPGSIYLAPGGFHMELAKNGSDLVIEINSKPPENSCRPAVDITFRSVAKYFGANILGVILTGMGKDGFNGSQVIIEGGGSILAQDEESSIVWGMPGYVTQNNLPEKVLPLNQMHTEILARIKAPLYR